MKKEYELAMEAGLADGGPDEEGWQLYIGTDKQWNQFEKLKEIEAMNEDWEKRCGGRSFETVVN